MLNFMQFLIERNIDNTDMAAAYETRTALHLHEQTGAAHNHNKAYQAEIHNLQKTYHHHLSKISPDMRKDVNIKAERSATAYLTSLAKQGIKSSDIIEAHHTPIGIHDIIGKKFKTSAERAEFRVNNPHDVLIKTKSGKYHGASLKATTGTASNNGAGAFEKESNANGIKVNTAKIWVRGMKKAGIATHSGKQIHDIDRYKPRIIKANQTTQHLAALDHARGFSRGTLANQKKHLLGLAKVTPAVPYDYVVGAKGTSTPYNHKPQILRINNAKSITTKVKNNLVHFYDQKNQHIGYAEHRPSHGPFSNRQVNFKFATH